MVTGSVATAGSPFDLGVLAVNVIGCGLLGATLVAAGLRPNHASRLRLGLGTGFCGGLTTFSTLTVRLAELIDDGSVGTALAELMLSVVLGVTALLAGRLIAHRAFSAVGS